MDDLKIINSNNKNKKIKNALTKYLKQYGLIIKHNCNKYRKIN